MIQETLPPPPPPEPRHSGLGIASFVLALLGGLLVCGGMGVTTLLTASGQDATLNSDAFLGLLGLTLICGSMFNLVGLGLGIAAVLQSNTNRLFGVLGLIFNTLTLCSLLGVMLLGILMPA